MLKNGFSRRKILITICGGRVWIVIKYLLFEKQTFNGLLKVIGIQINLSVYFTFTSYDFYSQFIERTNVLKTTSRISDFIAYNWYYIYYQICKPESFNTNISQQLFDYKITFVNSQLKNTNWKDDFVLKNRGFVTFVLKISGMQKIYISQKCIVYIAFLACKNLPQIKEKRTKTIKARTKIVHRNVCRV